MTEHPQFIDFDVGSELQAVAFSANGKYIMSDDNNSEVRVWRTEDGKQVASMFSKKAVCCFAVSRDDKWIAAGTNWAKGGNVFVWNAKTYEQVFKYDDIYAVFAVDFSPDSKRLLCASSSGTVTVWDVTTRKQIQTLRHEGRVRAAKYSPNGDRIATATAWDIRVWDSKDGRLLVDIKGGVVPFWNTGLVWFNDHLFVLGDNTIKRFDGSTGAVVAQWRVSDSSEFSCIALPKHGQFIVYSTNSTVTFWDTSTHTQLCLVRYPQATCSIALSPDDQLLAIGGVNGKISIQSVARIFVDNAALGSLMPLSRLHPTFQEPDIWIDSAALDSWESGQIEIADALLTTSISDSQSPSHHVFASRALVRARLQMWDAALSDAEKAIDIQPSVVAFIAKSLAYVGKGETHKGYRACDIAFERFHSSHVTFLLLVKAIVVFMTGDHLDAILRIDDLIATVPFNSVCYIVQAYMHLLIGISQMERSDYKAAIQSFEHARSQLLRGYVGPPLVVISLISGWKFDDLSITIEQRLCEALFAAGLVNDARKSLLEMVNSLVKEVYIGAAKWIADFTHRCLSLAEDGHVALKAARHDDAVMPDLPATIPLLQVWTRASLVNMSWKDTLIAATDFMVPRVMIYQAMCEHLEEIDHITDTSECFREMMDKLEGAVNAQDEQMAWIPDFKRRCLEKLENVGDIAMSAGQHHDAISHYSAALALDPITQQCLLIKRSKAHVAGGSWEAALDDATEVIELDPSSPWGYERKHAALHVAGDYEHAIKAFEVMLLKMSLSSDPGVLERHRHYTNPAETRMVIRKAVQDAICDLPPVLINTSSGRLVEKSDQAAAFESLPLFNKLISSTTTNTDHARIVHDVAQYYRYAMFSHKWEDNEPLFEQVIHMVVYDLDESVTHDKLKMFCKSVRDAGLHWAWSDTCCINKGDHFVLQEALVSMFKWYQGLALTLVLLRDVHSPSRRGNLVKSIWNTRAWTFQEYHASRVVRFYNKDWTLYRDLDIHNHKESPEILEEMEEATGISALALMALRPGLDGIRTKLCLASTRHTTLVEDTAYSLLGIFTMPLPVVYGEGDQALGRLLAQLLASSGDTSILAWTGKSGSFNSCLPARISVFEKLPITHIPAIQGVEMDRIVAALRSSSLGLTSATKLYDRLHALPVPSFSGQRMKLPCLAFKLGPLSATRSSSGRMFRAMTDALGTVEISSTEDLSRLDTLTLVHPWIDFLLDRHPVNSVIETITEETMEDQSSSIVGNPSSSSGDTSPTAAQSRTARLAARIGKLTFGARARDTASLLSPLPASPTDRRSEALRLVARLRQPFGALLFTPTRQNVEEYRRVASESVVTVRVKDNTPLNVLIASVQMLDVL